MNELVNDQEFKAQYRLFHQLQIQPDAAGVCAARSPLGLHLLDAPVGNANAETHLLFREKRRNKFAQSLAVPALQHQLAGILV